MLAGLNCCSSTAQGSPDKMQHCSLTLWWFLLQQHNLQDVRKGSAHRSKGLCHRNTFLQHFSQRFAARTACADSIAPLHIIGER